MSPTLGAVTLEQTVLAAIEPVDAALFQLVATGPNVPSEADMLGYESALGFALPAAFRALTLGSLGGLYVRARDEAWPAVAEFDIVPAWMFLRGVAIYGMATDIPQERLDLRFQLDEANERGAHGFAPVLRVDGDDQVYGFGADGTLLVEDGNGTVSAAEEQDFGTLYARLIAELIERQKQAPRQLP